MNKKKKDPIKMLELLKDWNKDCAEDFFKLASKYSDNCNWIAKTVAQVFEANYNSQNEILKEIKKRKKK